MDLHHDPQLLANLLTPTELENITPEIQKKLQKYVNDIVDEYCKNKVAASRLVDIEQRNEELQSHIQDYEVKIQNYEQNLAELRSQLDAVSAERLQLMEKASNYDKQFIQQRNDRTQFIDERDNLLKLTERQKDEIERLQNDNRMFQQQLKNAIAAKCEAIARVDEIESKETTFEYKERRLEQERDILHNQIRTLSQDLNRNVMELQNLRRDNTLHTVQLETCLSEKQEELKIAKNQCNQYKETIEQLTQHSQELSQKILKQNEDAQKMMEYYKKELDAKTKLADLYKSNCDDTDLERNELSAAIADLKRMLSEASDQYGELETTHKATLLSHEQQIDELNKINEQLRLDLSNANDFLQKTQTNNVDEALAKLAPTAAIASRLLRSDMSLTDIYSLYVKTADDLERERCEHAQVQLQLKQILEELNQNAPIYKKRESDFSELSRNCMHLKQECEQLLIEKTEMENKLQELQKINNSLERENKRLHSAQSDLNRQVCCLLQEVEELRTGLMPKPVNNHDIMEEMNGDNTYGNENGIKTANKIVSSTIVTFTSIVDLQANNQKLLLLVRDLTAQLESAEQFRKDLEEKQYSESIERYSRKVRQMEDMLHEREEAFKSILTKCERYKKLYFYLQKKLNKSSGDISKWSMNIKKSKKVIKGDERKKENNDNLEENSEDGVSSNIDDYDSDDIESLMDTESLDNEKIKSSNKSNSEHTDNDANQTQRKKRKTGKEVSEINEDLQKEYEKRIHDLKQQLDLFKEQYKTQKEQFEYYTKEKKNNEIMLNEQFDSMRNEVRELTSNNSKLLSTLEYNKEQIKLQNKNIATYKQQIHTLEERCKNYETTIIKHEQTLIFLKDEAMKSSHENSAAKNEAEHLRHDNRILKDSITRLQTERDSYHREQQHQSLLLNNLELIKSNLERSEMEGRIRIEQRLDETVRELSAQRRRFQEEEDRFREVVNDLKRQNDSANQQLAAERKEIEKLTQEISFLRSELTVKTQQIDELSKKLQSSLTPTTNDNPIVAANKRAREFELKYENTCIEMESIKNDLTKAREHAQQYYKMSQSAETEIKNLHDVHTSFVTKTENEIKELEKINLNQKSRITELEARLELFTINEKVTANQTEEENKLKEKLKDTLEKLSECSRSLSVIRDENTTLSESLHNVESKYANEMLLHSADLKQLSDIKVELSKVQVKIDAITGERDKLRAILNEEKRSTENTMDILKNEKQELENRIKDLNELNSHLHNQIEGLTTKLTVLSQASASATNSLGNIGNNSVSILNESSSNLMDTSMNSVDGSIVSDDNTKNSDQLLQIMKYLRKEKDVTMAKLDILKAENIRIQSERNILQKKCDELQDCLNRERSNTDAHLVSTSKHEEILRKIETINAITDSNRVLREERNTLNERCKELNERISKLETELFPLQKQNCELSSKIDELSSENNSLRTEAMKWRQRANVLVEKSNKNPEEFKRLQNERDNLTKILTSEREQHKQLTDEINFIKSERARLEGEITTMERQIQTLSEEKKTCSNELLSVKQNTTRLMQEIMELRNKLMQKEEAMQKNAEDLEAKEQQLQESKNKEFQIRKIAKRYKDSYLDLMNRTSGNANSNSNPDGANDNAGNLNPVMGNNSGIVAGDNSDLSGAGTSTSVTISDSGSGFSSIAVNAELQQNRKTIENLNNIIRTMQEESEKLRKSHEDLKASVELDERTKTLLREAKSHIVNLTDSRNMVNNELSTIKKKVTQINEEHEQVLNEYKRKHDEAIVRLDRDQLELNRNKEELTRMQRENESLTMRINQLNRQLGMQQASKPSTSSGVISEKSGLPESSPRTANVKPMSGSTSVQQSATVTPWRAGETPLASIRPISVQNITRTAAILPTSQQVTTVSGVVVAGTTSSTSSSTPSSASSATSGTSGICTSALTSSSSSSIISASTSSSVSTISTSSSTTLSSTSTSSALTSSSSTSSSSSTLSSTSSSLTTTPLSSSSSSLTSSTSTSSSAVTASGSSNTALVPPQQQVHTTAGNVALESMSSSSPTSSHADYMPSTSTAASSVAVATIPPMGSTTAAESSQEAESVQQQQQHIHHHQQQQQLHHHQQQQQQQQQMQHQADIQAHVVSGLGPSASGTHSGSNNMSGTSGVVVSNANNNVIGGSGVSAVCGGSSLGAGQQLQTVALVSPRVEGSTQSSQMSSGINALQMMQQEGVGHLHHQQQQQQQPSTSGTSSGVCNLHINVSSHSRHTPSSSNVTTTQTVAAGPSSISGHKRPRDHDGDFSSSSTTTTTATISSGSEVDQQDKKHLKHAKRMRSLSSALHHGAGEATATQIFSGNVGGVLGTGSGNAGCTGTAGGSGVHVNSGIVGAGTVSGGLGGAAIGASSGGIGAGISVGGISDSGMDADQMPTSSQRDQEDDVVVVDSDDEEDVEDREEDEEEEDEEEEEEDDDEEDGMAEAEADEGDGGPTGGVGDHEVYEDSYDQDNMDIDEENDCPDLRSTATREAENNEVYVDDNSGNQAQCSSAGNSRLGTTASGSDDTGSNAVRMLLGSGAESVLAVNPLDMELGSGACTSGVELLSGQENNQQSQTISSGTGVGSEMNSGSGNVSSPVRKQQSSTLTRQQKATLMMMQQQQQQQPQDCSPQDSHSAEAVAVDNLNVQSQPILPISVGSSATGSISGTVAATGTFTSGANTNTTMLSSSGSGSLLISNANLLGKSINKPSGGEVSGGTASMVSGNMSNEGRMDSHEEKPAVMQAGVSADVANVAATTSQSQLSEVQQSNQQITAAASSAGSSGENEGTDGVSSEGEKKAIEEIEEEGREAEASTSPSVTTRSKGVIARGVSNVGRRPARTTARVGNRPTPIVWQDSPGTSRNVGMQNPRNMAQVQDPLMASGRGGFPPHRPLRGRRLRRPAGNFPNTRYP